MAVFTTTAFTDGLKRVYGDMFNAILEETPLFSRIEKNKMNELGGQGWYSAVTVVGNPEVEATAEGATLGGAGSATVKAMNVSAKHMAVRIHLNKFVADQSRNDKMAFANAKAYAGEQAKIAFRRSMERQACQNGKVSGTNFLTGILATVTSAATNSATLKFASATSNAVLSEPGAYNLMEGMVVGIGTTAALQKTYTGTISVITDMDSITFTASVGTTPALNDYVVKSHADQSNYGAEIMGLEGICGNGTGTFQGIDGNAYSLWRGNHYQHATDPGGTSRTLTRELLFDAIQRANRRSERDVDLLLMDSIMLGQYYNDIAPEQRYVATTKDAAPKLPFQFGDIQILKTNFLLPNRVIGLVTKDLVLGIQSEFKLFETEDGNAWDFISNKLEQIATMTWSGELIAKNRNGHFILSDISATYPLAI